MDESTLPPTALPPAGWYTDPRDGSRDRWWTGEGWSEHTQERVPVAPPTTTQPTYPQPTYTQPAYAQPAYAQPAYAQSAEYTPMSYAGQAYSPRAYTAVDPRSEPLPGATIAQAFVRFWTKYAVFTGRASRSEYWWWTLTFSVIYAVLLIVTSVLPPREPLTLVL
jgi:hypothetical protein